MDGVWYAADRSGIRSRPAVSRDVLPPRRRTRGQRTPCRQRARRRTPTSTQIQPAALCAEASAVRPGRAVGGGRAAPRCRGRRRGHPSGGARRAAGRPHPRRGTRCREHATRRRGSWPRHAGPAPPRPPHSPLTCSANRAPTWPARRACDETERLLDGRESRVDRAGGRAARAGNRRWPAPSAISTGSCASSRSTAPPSTSRADEHTRELERIAGLTADAGQGRVADHGRGERAPRGGRAGPHHRERGPRRGHDPGTQDRRRGGPAGRQRADHRDGRQRASPAQRRDEGPHHRPRRAATSAPSSPSPAST